MLQLLKTPKRTAHKKEQLAWQQEVHTKQNQRLLVQIFKSPVVQTCEHLSSA